MFLKLLELVNWHTSDWFENSEWWHKWGSDGIPFDVLFIVCLIAYLVYMSRRGNTPKF